MSDLELNQLSAIVVLGYERHCHICELYIFVIEHAL